MYGQENQQLIKPWKSMILKRYKLAGVIEHHGSVYHCRMCKIPPHCKEVYHHEMLWNNQQHGVFAEGISTRMA